MGQPPYLENNLCVHPYKPVDPFNCCESQLLGKRERKADQMPK